MKYFTTVMTSFALAVACMGYTAHAGENPLEAAKAAVSVTDAQWATYVNDVVAPAVKADEKLSKLDINFATLASPATRALLAAKVDAEIQNNSQNFILLSCFINPSNCSFEPGGGGFFTLIIAWFLSVDAGEAVAY